MAAGLSSNDNGAPTTPPQSSNEDLSTPRQHPSSPRRTPALDVRNGSNSPRSNRNSLVLDLHASSVAQTAFTALQYMPVPVLVLGPFKTVVLANEAMSRLLCVSHGHAQDGSKCDCDDTPRALHGQTLSQIGVDLVQNEMPVWVDWEKYIDTIGESTSRKEQDSGQTTPQQDSGDLTPTLKSELGPLASDSAKVDRTTVHDVAVEVVVSTERCSYPPQKSTRGNAALPVTTPGVNCSMIISTWWADGIKYYTMTFFSTTTTKASSPSSGSSSNTSSKHTTRTVPKARRNFESPGSVSSSSSASGGPRSQSSLSNTSSSLSSPAAYIPNFPPSVPITQSGRSPSASVLQKATRLRDAVLNAMNLPTYALWKDHSVGIPNRALMDLCPHDTGPYAGGDFLARFQVFDEQFSRILEYGELPITELLRTEQASSGRRIGLKHPSTGEPKVYDCNAELVHDEETGDVVAGVMILKDVTEYLGMLAAQKDFTQKQFEYICNHVPPMIWTTKPDGKPDWFSNRWYQYTGLTPETSLGAHWVDPFNTDDMVATAKQWEHSLATGEEYVTEYRCRRRDGEYRWFLGNAKPMLDEHGEIVRWFGTCTDIHDAVESRESSRRMREQLQRVMETANLTLCSVDLEGIVTMIEGSNAWRSKDDPQSFDDIIGQSIFHGEDSNMTKDQLETYATPLNRILAGQSDDETCEFIAPSGKHFKHRYKPLLRTKRTGGVDGETVLDGATIVSFDVTKIRERELELRAQEKENAKLIANALAAKEASRLKSSFLANMSHEIRTPIAGVIGMAELLSDSSLNKDQAECAENILRSANGLLTVINDILDFSKVESGRLDIEEVQFSLSVVIQDVNKMLSFAAIRKNLRYRTHIDTKIANDLRVVGDPGRLRQVMTNVLTNSIKFTSEGHVSLSVKVVKDDDDAVHVEFTVEDTGIGIEDEIRKKLFTPFAQADSSTARRFGGTGLGLTISKNLVELMHGSIGLESKLGAGTKCVFCIPFKKVEYMSNGSPLVALGAIPDRLQSDFSVSMSSEERNGSRHGSVTSPIVPRAPRGIDHLALGIATAQLPSRISSGSDDEIMTDSDRANTHILVVEDNPVNQQIALKTIKKLNFSVNAVWNGQEAVDYMCGQPDASRPRPDIILMDVQMPILDGYKATQKIRRVIEDPSIMTIPIVAMTASAIQGDKEKCMKAGMDDYLAKVSFQSILRARVLC